MTICFPRALRPDIAFELDCCLGRPPSSSAPLLRHGSINANALSSAYVQSVACLVSNSVRILPWHPRAVLVDTNQHSTFRLDTAPPSTSNTSKSERPMGVGLGRVLRAISFRSVANPPSRVCRPRCALLTIYRAVDVGEHSRLAMYAGDARTNRIGGGGPSKEDDRKPPYSPSPSACHQLDPDSARLDPRRLSAPCSDLCLRGS